MDKPVKSILIIKPSSLGDIVHLFPALSLLHAQFPEAEFDFLVVPGFRDILFFAPIEFRHVILFNRKKMGTFKGILPEFLLLAKELRKEHYDLVIDFQGLLRSAFFAWITRHRLCIGYANPTEHVSRFFYNSKLFVARELHAVERCVRLACFASGIEFSIVPDIAPIRKVENIELPFVKYIAVLPGARWASKRFPISFFINLLTSINKKQNRIHFVLLGSHDDVDICREIVVALSGKIPVLDYSGKTNLGELVEFLRGASAVLCNDSGPMHIAAALKKEIFAFFGSTRPELTGPWGGDNIHVYRKSTLPCIGCLRRYCGKNAVSGVEPCHDLNVGQISSDVLKVLC